MSTIVVTGMLTDALGQAAYGSYGTRGRFQRADALASSEYRYEQPARIAVNLEHRGREIGTVAALELDVDQRIWAIAELSGVDHLLAPSAGPLYFSPELLHRNGTNVVIGGLAITQDPATIGLAPLTILPGDLRQAAEHMRCRRRPQLAARLDRAGDAQRRRRGGPIEITGRTAETEHRSAWPEDDENRAEQRVRAAPIEFHPGGHVLSVR
jgi:hypothetical protein